MRRFQQCLVVLSLATAALAAIRPIHLSKDEAEGLRVRGQNVQFDGEKITGHDGNGRYRRASDVPMATRAAFNDSNFFAIISYSGSDSQVFQSLDNSHI